MICQICGNELKSFGMPAHLKRTHKIEPKDYYDKYIEPGVEHKCVCGNDTSFISLASGYRQFCCQNCARRNTLEKTKEKYGVTNISQVKEINTKMRTSIKNSWSKVADKHERIAAVDIKVDQYCKEHNLVKLSDLTSIYGYGFIESDICNINLVYYKNRILIPKSEIYKIESYNNTKVRSRHETYIYNIAKSFYDDTIQNKRKVLGGLEIDIYIPSIKLGIEYNGNRFHCIESGKNKNYHLQKSLLCREKGIRLIHIYQFEDFKKQMNLLVDLLQGKDNYPKDDFNKNNLIDPIPKPEIIFTNSKRTVYDAGKLY